MQSNEKPACAICIPDLISTSLTLSVRNKNILERILYVLNGRNVRQHIFELFDRFGVGQELDRLFAGSAYGIDNSL